jgi:hypothetical protein
MKTINYLTILIIGFGFVACTSELEKDAQKIADFECEAKAFSKNTEMTEETINKTKKLGDEMIQFQKSISKKYKDQEDLVKLGEKVKEKIAETCNE